MGIKDYIITRIKNDGRTPANDKSKLAEQIFEVLFKTFKPKKISEELGKNRPDYQIFVNRKILNVEVTSGKLPNFDENKINQLRDSELLFNVVFDVEVDTIDILGWCYPGIALNFSIYDKGGSKLSPNEVYFIDWDTTLWFMARDNSNYVGKLEAALFYYQEDGEERILIAPSPLLIGNILTEIVIIAHTLFQQGIKIILPEITINPRILEVQ